MYQRILKTRILKVMNETLFDMHYSNDFIYYLLPSGCYPCLIERELSNLSSLEAKIWYKQDKVTETIERNT